MYKFEKEQEEAYTFFSYPFLKELKEEWKHLASPVVL